eukprot:50154-Eustigmatos_ZCMA.PRE.1
MHVTPPHRDLHSTCFNTVRTHAQSEISVPGGVVLSISEHINIQALGADTQSSSLQSPPMY